MKRSKKIKTMVGNIDSTKLNHEENTDTVERKQIVESPLLSDENSPIHTFSVPVSYERLTIPPRAEIFDLGEYGHESKYLNHPTTRNVLQNHVGNNVCKAGQGPAVRIHEDKVNASFGKELRNVSERVDKAKEEISVNKRRFESEFYNDALSNNIRNYHTASIESESSYDNDHIITTFKRESNLPCDKDIGEVSEFEHPTRNTFAEEEASDVKNIAFTNTQFLSASGKLNEQEAMPESFSGNHASLVTEQEGYTFLNWKENRAIGNRSHHEITHCDLDGPIKSEISHFSRDNCDDLPHLSQEIIHKQLNERSIEDKQHVCSGNPTKLSHKSTHSENRQFSCSDCPAEFSSEVALNLHVKKHVNDKLYICSCCNKGFSSKTTLNRHIKTCVGEKPFECIHCKAKFSFKSLLNRHFRVHHLKPFECKQCNAKFSRKRILIHHLRLHTGEKPYECKHCNAKFARKGNLKTHIRIHTGEKRFECTHCKAKFLCKETLKRHLRIHTGEKPYECKHCNAKFANQTTLIFHIRIHTGEKPFECTHCKAKFSRKESLKRHFRVHSGEKPFECNDCHVKFSHKANLMFHMRRHTGEIPFECKYCNEIFAHEANLKDHIRVHTGEKPYGCKHCSAKFARKGNLKTHIRIHTGEKPFECTHCKAKFSFKVSLNRHLKIQHCSAKFWDTDSVRRKQIVESPLLRDENSPIHTYSVAVTCERPTVPSKTEILDLGEYGHESKYLNPSTSHNVSQNHVGNNVGKAVQDYTVIMHKDKVDTCFGKELRIVLERVDKIKKEISVKERRCTSEPHGGALSNRKRNYDTAAVTSKSSYDNEYMFRPIIMESNATCDKNMGRLSEFNHLKDESLADAEEMEVEVVKFSNIQFQSINGKWDEPGIMPECSSGIFNYAFSNNIKKNLTAVVESESSYNNDHIITTFKRESNLPCDKDIGEVSEFEHPTRNTFAEEEASDVKNIAFTNTQFLSASGKLNEQEAMPESFSGNHASLVTEQEGYTFLNWKENRAIGNRSHHEITHCDLDGPIKSEISHFSRDNCDDLPHLSQEIIHKQLNERSIEDKQHVCSGNPTKLSHKSTHSENRQFSCSDCPAEFSSEVALNLHVKKHVNDKLYICSCCNKGFSSKTALNRHIKTCMGEKPFECIHCKVKFSFKSSLNRHFRVHHLKPFEKPFECKQCNAKFSRKRILIHHLRLHTGEKPYECKHCNAKFARKGNLKTHIRIHTGEKRFECTHCKAKFLRKETLKRHLRIHTGEKPYECKHCNAKFANQATLIFHIRIHTGEKPFECTHCKAKFSRKESLKRHFRVHSGEKPFECNDCHVKFSHKANLMFHMRRHTGEIPFECKYCNEIFAHEANLKDHIRVHTGEKPYGCKHCSAKFARKGNLKTHIRIHTGEKPFECTHCKAKFSFKVSLNRHLKIHAGEKPYECKHCNAKFAIKGDLKTHIRIHTGEKRFECTHCKVKLTRKESLKRHFRVHSGEKPFECNDCHVKFSLKANLMAHMRIHKGEKPFECNYCNAKFAQKANLKDHIRVHTGEKPYGCKHCSAKFALEGNLKTHSRIQTGEKPFECTHCKAKFSFKVSLNRHLKIQHCSAKFWDTDSVRRKQIVESPLLRDENSPIHTYSVAVTCERPTVPSRTEIFDLGEYDHESKYLNPSTSHNVSQNHFGNNVGKAVQDYTVILHKDKVDTCFGKELRIVLERVDKIKKEISVKERRCTSESHGGALSNRKRNYDTAAVTSKSSYDNEYMFRPIIMESNATCDKNMGRLSEFNHLKDESLADAEEMEVEVVKFSNIQFQSINGILDEQFK